MSNALAAGSLPQSPQDAAGAPPVPAAQGAPPDAQAAAPDASVGPPAPAGAPPVDPTAPPPSLAEAGIDPEKLSDAIYKTAAMDAKLTDVLDKPTVMRGDIITMMTQIVAEDIMSPASAAAYLGDIPEEPDDIREWAQRHHDEGKQLLAQMVFALHGSAPQAAPTGEPGAPPEEMPPMPTGMPQ